MKHSILVFLALLTSMVVHGNVILDNAISNEIYLTRNMDSLIISNQSFINCRFVDCGLDDISLKDVSFNHCEFENSEYIRRVRINSVRLDNCELKDLSLYDSEVKNLYCENSTLTKFEFINCNVNRLIIKNCKTTSIKLQNSRLNEVIMIGGSFNDIEFIEVNGRNIEIGQTKCNRILFKSGSVSRIKLINIELAPTTQIKFVETIINFPRFSNNILPQIDLTRANIDFNTFQLLNDFDSDNGLFSLGQARSNYLEARDSYYLILKQFQNAGIKEGQRKLEYLINESYVKSLHNSISKFIYVIWNKHLRGYYGLEPLMVVATALKVWILFALIFFILGHFTNIGWALLIPLNIHGEAMNNIHPRFLNPKSWKVSSSYFYYCVLFSLQQLIIPGFSKSGLTFFRGIFFTSSLFIPIGIGKLISFIEYLFGLIIIFNFIQAFVRTL